MSYRIEYNNENIGEEYLLWINVELEEDDDYPITVAHDIALYFKKVIPSLNLYRGCLNKDYESILVDSTHNVIIEICYPKQDGDTIFVTVEPRNGKSRSNDFFEYAINKILVEACDLYLK